MHRFNKLTNLILGVSFILALPFSALAIEHIKQDYSFEMQVSITTVTNSHFGSYDAIINKPLAQIVEVASSEPLANSPEKNHNLFELAMHVQDKVQYYMAVIEDTFSSEPSYQGGECKSGRVAKIASLFSL
ncbi:hypothetical protein [Thalassotalea aquiviva]|uniref:hypothetical protein n=1 Tax=Thalassotalea aquiviva TaxID=3242415 RepID=UPI00352BB591